MMSASWIRGAWLVVLAVSLTTAHGETLVETLLSGYDTVHSVSCEVRRDADSGGGPVRSLSRVFFERPDRLHVENVSPLTRRIVCDGTNLFSYVTGDRKGFSRPVARLDADMLISLRKVPASPMDHLLRLRGMAETNLPPTEPFPVRRGYDTGKQFAVLSLDTSNRLARIEFFTTADLGQRTALIEYSRFVEATPGVWLALLHRTTLWMNGAESHETSRFESLAVNQPIAPNLFNASLFFTDIAFVDSFDDMYP